MCIRDRYIGREKNDRCGEIWNCSTCRGISDFSTQQMWRNVKFCQIWRIITFLHMTDVKKNEIYPVLCCKICFVAIYAVFYEIRFGAIYKFLRGEKLSQKSARCEKKWQISGMLLEHLVTLKMQLRLHRGAIVGGMRCRLYTALDRLSQSGALFWSQPWLRIGYCITSHV